MSGLVSVTANKKGATVLDRLTSELFDENRKQKPEERKEKVMPLLASDFDKSKYMKAVDFDREKKFRIKAVTAEKVGEDKEPKLVVWFTNDERGLILNRTNNRTLREAFGDNTDGWVQKIILIVPTMADLRGKQVQALRVRILPPKPGNGATPTPAAPTPVNGGTPATATPTTATPTPAAAPVAAAALDSELADEPKSLADVRLARRSRLFAGTTCRS
jgi:hypothetical protein